MEHLIGYPLEDGGMLVVQAAGPDSVGSLGLASPEDKLKKAGETLESALSKVTPALKTMTSKLRDLSPDGLTVEFGLTLTAESGAIVAKGGAEVHFTVTIAWPSSEPGSPPVTDKKDHGDG
jgi:hypothetical protein